MTRLRGLSCLPYLSRIEISILYRRTWCFHNTLLSSNGGNPELVQGLHQELRKLSIVYIMRPDNWYEEQYQFEVWELANDTWQSEEVDEDTYYSTSRKSSYLMLGLE